MKKQLTLAGNEFERFRKPTRRECFLAEMDTAVPCCAKAASATVSRCLSRLHAHGLVATIPRSAAALSAGNAGWIFRGTLI